MPREYRKEELLFFFELEPWLGTEDIQEAFLEKVKFELSLEGKGGISYAGKGWVAKYLLLLLDRTDFKKTTRWIFKESQEVDAVRLECWAQVVEWQKIRQIPWVWSLFSKEQPSAIFDYNFLGKAFVGPAYANLFLLSNGRTSQR